MFGIGTAELLVIAVIGLIVLGPNKLPGMFSAIGKGIREFRRTLNDVGMDSDSEHKDEPKDGGTGGVTGARGNS